VGVVYKLLGSICDPYSLISSHSMDWYQSHQYHIAYHPVIPLYRSVCSITLSLTYLILVVSLRVVRFTVGWVVYHESHEYKTYNVPPFRSNCLGRLRRPEPQMDVDAYDVIVTAGV
jgi:hypothetical protein